MRLQDAKEILKEAKQRVCRHHPRLVLTEAELSIFEQVQQGVNNPVDIAHTTEKKIENVRNILTQLIKKGYLTRVRETPLLANNQYIYSVYVWKPKSEVK